MAHRLPVERIDLGGGDFALVNRHLLVKTQRAIREYCLANTPEGQETKPETLRGHERDLFRLFFVNQTLELRLSKVERVKRLWWRTHELRQEAYTPPFDFDAIMEDIDDVAFEKMDILQREFVRLYAESPLGGG